MNIRYLLCCGGIELDGINDPKWTPESWLEYYATCLFDAGLNGKSFCAMSYAWDVGKVSGGRSIRQGNRRCAQWKAFIEDNNFGQVNWNKKGEFNPNYGRTVRIRAGLFTPNNEEIQKWWEKKASKKKNAAEKAYWQFVA